MVKMKELQQDYLGDISDVDLKGVLSEFPKFEHGLEDSYQASAMIDALNMNYKRTKEEIKNVFSKDEALFIYQSRLNSMYEAIHYYKKLLITDIKDTHEYDPFSLADVNVEALVNKIQLLTEFQCFTILMMVIEVREKANPLEDFTSILLDVFQPTGEEERV